ncbi:hypothetical protein DDZ18_02610 [Marinicauda salina]|uniref:DUF5801 domain-containing protein n=1 Tax=Marinicauda salina TaxID=2135793 RepID=A0A2U2BWW7_9PROT|nr:cadherin-like domain-containing protein [Marinicauda salina]PWE18516.1 hypothetical protein DDZ18_02610 [Marinicauda salina]
MASTTFILEAEVDTQVRVTEQPDGSLLFEIEVLTDDGSIGDLRGLFFDFDDSLLGGLSITGPDITDYRIAEDDVVDLGHGANVRGEVANTYGRYDAGVEFGTQGIAQDDIQSTSFTLSHDGVDLTLDMLGDVAVRLTSVGEIDGDREGSLKTGDIDYAPEIDVAEDTSVDEDGLAGGDGPAGLASDAGEITIDFGGDVPADPSTALTLFVDGLDGQLTSGGVPVTFAVEGGDIVGRAGGTEVIRIAITGSTDNGDGTVTYTYETTLSGVIDHGAAGEDDQILSGVDFTATDADGDAVSGEVDVTINDDTPEAFDDGATQATENDPVTIDVFANDEPGADGAATASVALVSGSLTGAGSLVNNGDGSFTYTPAAGEEGSVSFAYTITDADADVSQATATIELQPDSVPEISAAATDLFVDDDDTEGGVSTDTGSVTIDYGNDSAGASFTFSTDGLAGEIQTLDGQDVVFAIEGGALVGRAQADNSIVIEIEVTGSTDNGDGTITYDYEVTQHQPLQHADPNTEDDASITVSFTGTDGDDGDDVDGTFDVTINDDVPEAFDDSFTQSEENADVTGNVLANNGAGADAFGADGANSPAVTDYTLTSGAGSLTVNGDGSFTYEPGAGEEGPVTFGYTITDGDGDTSEATATITLQDDSEPVVGTAGNTIVDEDGLPGGDLAASAASDTGEITIDYGNDVPADPGAALVLLTDGLDGQGLTSGGDPVTFAIEGGSGDLVGSANGEEVIRIAITGATDNADGTVTYAYETTLSGVIDHDAAGEDDVVLSSVGFTATDGDDSDTVSGSIDVTINDDSPEAFDDSFTQAEENADVTGDVLADNGNSADSAGADGEGSPYVQLVGGSFTGSGNLTLNADGTFTYTPGAGEEGSVSFDYTITDADGDESTATATIDLQPDSTPEIDGAPADLGVDEDGLPGGDLTAAAATDSGSVTIDYGNDSADANFELSAAGLDGQLTSNGFPVVFALEGGEVVGRADGTEVIRISITGETDNGDGAVTYDYDVELSQPVEHAGAGEDDAFLLGVGFTATDGDDGDDVSGTFDVAINDDSPEAFDDSFTQSEENADVSGNVLADNGSGADSAGADGESSPYVELVSGSFTGSGDLTLNADGTFTYTPAAGEEDPVSFDYTITDADGDVAQATATITLQTDSEPAFDAADDVTVDEDGFAFANDDDATSRTDETDSTESLTGTGSAVFTFGNDVPGDLLGSIDLLDDGALDGQLQTLDGDAVNFSLEGGDLVGRSAGDDSEVIRISITGASVTDPSTGEVTYDYAVTLSQPVEHVDGGVENSEALLNVGFEVTDGDDGDAAQGSFDVSIVDDVPQANDDSYNQADQGGENTAVSGNVIDNDAFGADGDASDPQVSLISDVSKGSLTLNADGSFTFTPDAGQEGSVSFTYQIVDQDGDVSEAVATINLEPDSTPEISVAATDLFVDDDDTDGGVSTDTGSVTIDYGNDAAGATFAFSTDGLAGEIQTLDGQDVVFAIEGGVLVGRAQADNSVVIEVEVTGSTPSGDEVTYDYQVTQHQPLQHADPDTEDDDSITVSFTGADGDDGDDVSGTFDVTINDDVPEAFDDSFTQTNENDPVSGNVLANNGAGADAFGADGADSPAVTDYTLTSGAGSLTVNPDGTFTYEPAAGEESSVTFDYTITDGDGDTDQATATITLQPDSEPVVSAAEDAFVDEDGLPGGDLAASAASDTGEITIDYGNDVPADPGAALVLLTDGLDAQSLTSGGDPVTFAIEGGTGDLVGSANGEEVIRIAITGATDNGDGTVTYAYETTLSGVIDHDAAGEDDVVLSNVGFTATDGDDSDTVSGSIAVTIDDDVPEPEDDAYNQADQGGENTAVSGNVIDNDAFGADGDASDPQVSLISDVAEGSLTLNADGSFTFTPDAGQEDPVSFTYQIVDQDGDVSEAVATINLEPDSTPEISEAATDLFVDDDDTDGGGTSTDTGSVTIDYGNDVGGASFAFSTDGLAGELQTLDGQDVVFAIEGGALVGRAQSDNSVVIEIEVTGSTDNGDGTVTYDYEVTQSVPLQHADPNSEDDDSITVQFDVSDGDDGDALAAPGSFDVTINDATPDANNDGVIAVPEDTAVTFDVFANDDFGADGVDTDNDPDVAVTWTQPAKGVVTYDASSGEFTYTPGGGEEGADSFTYTIIDGDGDESTATVQLNIAPDSEPLAGDAADLALDDDDLVNPGVSSEGGVVEIKFFNDQPGDTEAELLDAVAFDPATLTTLNAAGYESGGETIVFAIEGGTGDIVGSTSEGEVIRIAITGATPLGGGAVDYAYEATQSLPIDHPQAHHKDDPGAEDNLPLSGITLTATDSDGDPVSVAFDVDLDDDVPDFLFGDDLSIVNEAPSEATGSLTFEAGGDGIGEVVFLGTDGDQAFDSDGNPLLSEGEPIFLYGFDSDTLEGRVGSDGAPDPAGDTVFTITLDPDTGEWSAQFAVDIQNGSEISVTDLAGVTAGNSDIQVIGADDAINNGDDVDIILDGDPGPVNTSSEGIAVGNQSIGAGEAVQMEFVHNAVTDGDTATGFDWDGVVEANAFKQEIQQVQGPQSNTTAILVEALATDGDQDIFGEGSLVEITEVRIYDEFGVDITDSWGGTIDYNGDGSVNISGLEEGEFYEIHTDDLFSGVRVSANDSDPDFNNFDLGAFSIFALGTGDPFDMNFDVRGFDGDGDWIDGTLDLTVEPAAEPLAASATSATEIQLLESGGASAYETDGSESALMTDPAAGFETAAFAGPGLFDPAALLGPAEPGLFAVLEADGFAYDGGRFADAFGDATNPGEIVAAVETDDVDAAFTLSTYVEAADAALDELVGGGAATPAGFAPATSWDAPAFSALSVAEDDVIAISQGG